MTRRRVYIITIGIGVTIILWILISNFFSFIHLFLNHQGIELTQDEVKAAHVATSPDERPQHIPKIIHQVYHDWGGRGMPADWNKLRQSCINLNPDWEYKLWSTNSSRDFLQSFYPWFLDAYDDYAYPVQRVDALKYFLMRHYGGIYIDMDNGCLESLDPLRYYQTWTVDGGRGALSNNILGSAPDHPFWIFLTDSLLRYNYNYLFPYVTISYATGQWFQTSMWEQYHRSLGPPRNPVDNHNETRLYRVLTDNRPGTDPWVFFSQGRGETWVNWDNYAFLLVGDHLVTIVFAGLVICTSFLWWLVRCWRSLSRGKAGYDRVQSSELELGKGNDTKSTHTRYYVL